MTSSGGASNRPGRTIEGRAIPGAATDIRAGGVAAPGGGAEGDTLHCAPWSLAGV